MRISCCAQGDVIVGALAKVLAQEKLFNRDVTALKVVTRFIFRKKAARRNGTGCEGQKPWE